VALHENSTVGAATRIPDIDDASSTPRAASTTVPGPSRPGTRTSTDGIRYPHEHSAVLNPLRSRLEYLGHTCHTPGFKRNFLVTGELQKLLETIDSIPGPVVLIGHSAGGLLAVLAARRRDKVTGIIGLGSAVVGRVDLTCPYFEARSLVECLVPIRGIEEVKVFPVEHIALPMWPCVQRWVLKKVAQLE
jgi:pimeloyl-ACP methyl ester carboxylesterase